MQISDRGVVAIARHEGIALGPYRDTAGVWTMGVGHTAAAGAPDPARHMRPDTRGWGADRLQAALRDALILLRRDLEQSVARVNAAIHVPLRQHQFDALVSFEFNTGGIGRARLTREINKGDLSGAGFMGWLRPKEIIPRRKAEQALFLTGDYQGTAAGVPVYDGLPDGGLRYRCSLDGAELLTLLPAPGAGAVVNASARAAPAGQGGVIALLQRIFGLGGLGA